jgi:hypothetical protein
MTIDQLKAIASDPCINLSGLLKDANVSRSTFDQYVTGKRGKYGIKKEVSDRMDDAVNRLFNRLNEAR